MSFNRLKYDEDEQKYQLNSSISKGLYSTNTPVICGSCFETNPHLRLQKSGVSMNSGTNWRFYNGPVDVESDLKNITRPVGIHNMYKPECKGYNCDNQGQPCGAGVIASCEKNSQNHKPGGRAGDENLVDFPDCYFPTEDTRLSNPVQNLRGTGINRFESLCIDPQKNIMFPGDYQIPSRLIFKDNHRPCIPTPAINSMIPEQKPLPCEQTQSTCGSYTSPLYKYDVCG
jgi:hypothetical protein